MKPMTPEGAGRELAKVLDLVDREREALADVVKERKGRIARLEKRARELRDLATGRDGVQGELDTEVAAVLGEAGAVAERKGGR
jgi:hypothetical protein